MDGMAVAEVLPRDQEEIAWWLARLLAGELGMSPEEVEVTAPFASFGLSSIAGVSLAGEIADELGVDLPATIFWDYPTIEKLADHLVGLRGIQDRAA